MKQAHALIKIGKTRSIGGKLLILAEYLKSIDGDTHFEEIKEDLTMLIEAMAEECPIKKKQPKEQQKEIVDIRPSEGAIEYNKYKYASFDKSGKKAAKPCIICSEHIQDDAHFYHGKDGMINFYHPKEECFPNDSIGQGMRNCSIWKGWKKDKISETVSIVKSSEKKENVKVKTLLPQKEELGKCNSPEEAQIKAQEMINKLYPSYAKGSEDNVINDEDLILN